MDRGRRVAAVVAARRASTRQRPNRAAVCGSSGRWSRSTAGAARLPPPHFIHADPAPPTTAAEMKPIEVVPVSMNNAAAAQAPRRLRGDRLPPRAVPRSAFEKDDDVLAARVREDLEALGGRLRALPGSNPAMAAKSLPQDVPGHSSASCARIVKRVAVSRSLFSRCCPPESHRAESATCCFRGARSHLYPLWLFLS